MELTKQQIQFIDNRLENEGVKYWDIRIEMLDHVVSDIEQKLKSENSEYEFKEMVQESFISLGWKENFNGGGFEKVISARLKMYNKNQNKNFKQYFKETFLKLNYILGTVSLAISVIYFQENKFALKFIFFSMMVIYVSHILRFFIKYKLFNSARLNSAILFATFPMTIFNILIYVPDVFFEYKMSIFNIYVVLVIINPFLAIGLSYFNNELKKAQKIYNQLIS